MPDSFGKRQRDQVKARKAAARDERRVARNKRRKDGPQPEQTGEAEEATPMPIEEPDGAPRSGG